MRAGPAPLIAATFAGAAVGLGLAANGLWARLTGSFVEGGLAGSAWSALPGALHLEAGAWGLTVVTLGVLWWGGLGALWTRVSWGRPATVLVAVLSLAFPPLGTILSALVLLLLSLPVSRAWWAMPAAQDGG